MPILDLVLGGVDFTGQASVAYGKFIQSCVDFTVVAFVIFIGSEGDEYHEKEGRGKASSTSRTFRRNKTPP